MFVLSNVVKVKTPRLNGLVIQHQVIVFIYVCGRRGDGGVRALLGYLQWRSLKFTIRFLKYIPKV